MHSPAIALESNQQFIEAFSTLARGFKTGEVWNEDGLTVMMARSPVFVFNAFGLRTPVASAGDLAARVDTMLRIQEKEGVTCCIAICEQMLDAPLPADQVDTLLASHAGLIPVAVWTGMVCDTIVPAKPRPDPLDIELRPVNDSATRIAVNDVNMNAYGMPVEPGRESFDCDSLWAGLHAIVGYKDGEAVATATAFPIADSLYVAMVATDPAHRRKGYAEACMREALRRAGEASGISRTSLHATPDGYPIYARMGYRDRANFRLYARLG